MSAEFTLLTYNVHEAVGSDQRQNYTRIVEIIQRINPDIITLQEVDIGNTPSTAVSFLFEAVSKSLPFNGIEGITMIRAKSSYGNAIFAKIKPLQVRRHDISYKDREPRGVLDCLLEINDNRIRILNTHLGLKQAERSFQIQTIRQILQSQANVPTILSGDFNEWKLFSRRIRNLKQDMELVNSGRTFPSRLPLFKLDRIFYNHRLKLIKTFVYKTQGSRRASDHLPLVAKFSLL